MKRALVPVLLATLGLGCEQREPEPSVTVALEAGAYSCDDLGRAYEAALAEARKCAPSPAASCSVEVEDRLGCACPTFVSSANARMVQSLRTIKRKWTEQMCAHSVGCVPTRCAEGARGECSAVGRCVDSSR
jgi:hypothetical protein